MSEEETDFRGGNYDSVAIPKTTVNKVATEVLGSVHLSSDAKELLVGFCSEFVQLISSHANQLCEKESKRVISPEHILQSLEELGFGDYCQEVKQVYEEFLEIEKRRSKTSWTRMTERTGLTEEELIRQQEELFAKARENPLADLDE
ncbi:Protein Dr1 [Galdieria sulphuraria]|nr:Protein Dr1 [Galdieria sulphuraria]